MTTNDLHALVSEATQGDKDITSYGERDRAVVALLDSADAHSAFGYATKLDFYSQHLGLSEKSRVRRRNAARVRAAISSANKKAAPYLDRVSEGALRGLTADDAHLVVERIVGRVDQESVNAAIKSAITSKSEAKAVREIQGLADPVLVAQSLDEHGVAEPHYLVSSIRNALVGLSDTDPVTLLENFDALVACRNLLAGLVEAVYDNREQILTEANSR